MILVTLILPTQNPQFPPVVPLASWVVIRVFLIILLILEDKIVVFIDILGFSEKTDVNLLARITKPQVGTIFFFFFF